MGLLSKAVVKVSPELDEMGKVLRDRILRLPVGKNAPDTALSLLKAYSSFQRGICFSLFEDSYESYASSGMGEKKIRFPRDIIDAPAVKEGFYRLDKPDLFSTLSIPQGNILWVFSLDNTSDRNHILLITEEGNSLFNPEAMAAILFEIRRVLILPPETGETAFTGQDQTHIAGGIRQYLKNQSFFQGIILQFPRQENGETKADFTEKVSRMVSSFGSVFSLSTGNCLTLFSKTMDRELLAHRLSKSLNTQVVYHFQADDPDTALSQLGPYL
jgi:hypothetical protein